MRLSWLLREYGEYRETVPAGAVWERSRQDRRAKIAIYDPKTGAFLWDHERSSGHAVLIMKLRKIMQRDPEQVQNAYKLEDSVCRAYWLPGSGDLFLYQMVTPLGTTIDPPDDVIQTIIDKLDIRGEVLKISIVG